VASLIYLDTHVAIWLYALGRGSLSLDAASLIASSDDVRLSPMVRLELQYLFEIGRVTQPAAIVVDALQAAVGVTVCGASFAEVARRAESNGWTRDPFDRLIVAHAALHDAPLVTKDQSLHAHYSECVW
jgi:PIN domain nuclease of toxin-antitoxin system